MPAPRPAAPELDVLCVGLLCVDLVLAVPRHPGPDEKLRATARLLAPGGPAAVAAAQISRLGGRASFAGAIGDDSFAPILRAALAAEGVDTAALISPAGQTTAIAAILVKPDAARAVVSHASASGSLSAPAQTLPPARVILADGHRPEWTPALVSHARATGAPLVLDAGSWNDAVRELAPHADHLVASEACARSALQGRDPADASPPELRAALLAGPAAVVVVTLGPRGLIWQTADDHGATPAFRIKTTDTTGAGDAFHGAYALGLARGLPLHDRLRLASAAGALACTRPGAWASLPTTAEIEALLATSS